MFRFLRALCSGRDDERRHETPADDKARMLEMDEPMAGAGAQLSGERSDSETEKALRRATDKRPEWIGPA
jgi:hypothetical protein